MEMTPDALARWEAHVQQQLLAEARSPDGLSFGTSPWALAAALIAEIKRLRQDAP